MSTKQSSSIRETDLYRPIYNLLDAQGFTVRAEVKGCDITAKRGDEFIVIEMKRSFTTALLVQAINRQKVTDSVYVAVPKPHGNAARSNWTGIKHLLRRLELGLIWIDFNIASLPVEIVFHPLPYEHKRSHKNRRAILKEIDARPGDYNEGGCTRRKIITAYRFNALHIAVLLDKCGPMSPKQLRTMGAGPKTLTILNSNFYGWFKRIARGTYDLRPEGKQALIDFPEPVDALTNLLQETGQNDIQEA